MRVERYNSTAPPNVSPPSLTSMRRYGVPPYAGDLFFSVDRYAERLSGAMDMRGFEIVAATVDDLLVGIGHGVTLPRDVAWWLSIKDSQPTQLIEAAEAGNIFWLRCRCARCAATRVSAENCTTTCALDGAKRHHHDRHHRQ